MNFHSHTAHLKQARTTHSERPEITSLDREEKHTFLSSDRDGRIVSLGNRYGGIAAWVHLCVSSPEGTTAALINTAIRTEKAPKSDDASSSVRVRGWMLCRLH